MRHPQYTVTRADVHHHTQRRLEHHLRLTDYSRKCTRQVLLAVVLTAAARLTSLFVACQRLLQVPSAETVRKALLATLPQQAELQRRLNRALAADRPKALQRRRQRLAIDLTLIPYHGQPFAKESEIYRSQARDGTSHFHAYVTVYVIRKGQRFTVAFTAVEQGEPLATVVQRLLRQAARVGVRPSLVLLDRGFDSVGVIRYLQAARSPFLMPVVCRGRQPDHPQGPSGTQVFHQWKQSDWGSYTLTEKGGRTATVGICVKCRNYRGQWKKHGRQTLVYAYWGFKPASWHWVQETYRQRFAIETSYRQMQEARIKTCRRSPVVRLFLIGVALLLRNVWVWLHDEVLSTPWRGGRRINLERLRFKTLLLWLLHVVEET
ncbi:MAG: transposase [Planctomycetia bacterium]|nr:transposase [Planctomycetia bacterium]